MENSILFTYLLVGGFLLLNLAIGLYKGRNIASFKDYATGNRSYSTGSLVMTYIATLIGGGTIFNNSIEVYRDGILVFLGMLGVGLSLIFRSIYLAPKFFYFRGSMTMGDMFGKLYGKNAKYFTGVKGIIVSILAMTIQISVIGLICDRLLGLDKNISIIMGGICVILYSTFGGMRAVVATDIFQFILLSVCIVIVTNVAVGLAGGFSNIMTSIPVSKFNILGNPSLLKYTSVFLMWGLFSADMQTPSMTQRMLMAGNGNSLKKMLMYSGVLNIVIMIMVALIGLASIILYPNGDKADIITSICHDFLHPYLQPIVVIGLLAIVLSSADSYMHSAGVSFTNDIVVPLVEKNRNSVDSVKIAKVSTFIIGSIGVIVSLMGCSLAQLTFFVVQIAIPFTACPMLLGICGLKSDEKSFFISVGAVIIAFIICKFSLPGYMVYLIAPITSTISGLTLIFLHLMKYKKFVWEKREDEIWENLEVKAKY